MDRRLLERLVGGSLLLLVVLAVVPLMLTGERPVEPALVQLPAVPGSGELRTHVITPERSPAEPPVPQHLPPPAPAALPPEQEAQGAVEPRGEGAGGASTPSRPAALPAPAAEPTPPPAVAEVPSPSPALATPPAPSPAAPGTGWVVQIGSFQDQANAERLAAELRDRNFQAYVTPLSAEGGTLYRVRVGPAGRERSEAQALAGRLTQSGYSGQLTRQEP